MSKQSRAGIFGALATKASEQEEPLMVVAETAVSHARPAVSIVRVHTSKEVQDIMRVALVVRYASITSFDRYYSLSVEC